MICLVLKWNFLLCETSHGATLGPIKWSGRDDKGLKLCDFRVTGIGTAGGKAEDLPWSKMLLQRAFLSAAVGRAKLQLQRKRFRSEKLCAGAQCLVTVAEKSNLFSCAPDIFFKLFTWQTCARNTTVSGQRDAAGAETTAPYRREAPAMHRCTPRSPNAVLGEERAGHVRRERGCCAQQSYHSPFTVQQSKRFSYALFPPPVAHGSILTQPVETRWADSAPYLSP